jgi:hypothetical protein
MQNNHSLKEQGMKTTQILGVAALALFAHQASANAVVVNQGISEQEVLAAQQGWCAALVNISNTHEASGQAAAKTLAENVIDAAYGYQMGAVL